VKNITNAKTKIISSTVQTVLDKIDEAWKTTEPFLDQLMDTGDTYWIVGFSVSIVVMIITLMFMSGITFACQANAEGKSSMILTASSVIASLASLGLFVFITWGMLLGGHGNVFLCDALNDYPNYTILTKLLDQPGIIYKKPLADGLMNEIIKPPSVNAPELSVNVSLASVINSCEDNKPAYLTFQLGQLVNVRRVLDMKKYLELEEAIDDIKATEALFIGFTTGLQNILSEMVYETDMNISSYRIDLTFISPEKDIVTFIDQMQRVSAQIQDVSTSSRMTTLGSRAKRVQMSLLQPLEHLRGEIVYHLTALELEIEPWTTDVSTVVT
jgi:Prominin